jgi:hypothetical protein
MRRDRIFATVPRQMQQCLFYYTPVSRASAAATNPCRQLRGRHAAADDLAFEHVESGEHHRRAAPGIERPPGRDRAKTLQISFLGL